MDLNQVLREVFDDLESQINQSEGEVTIHRLPSFKADPRQMYQVFVNLVSNALNYRRPFVTPTIKIGGRRVVIRLRSPLETIEPVWTQRTLPTSLRRFSVSIKKGNMKAPTLD